MRTDLPRLALWALVAIVVLGLVVGGSTSGTAYGAFNPSWDGGSTLRGIAESEGADARYIQETADYDSLSNQSVAFVLSPDESYDANDSARVRAFVERGGTLVVADDTTGSNSLLASVGSTARIDGRLVRDERRYYRGPSLPIATNVSDPATLTNRSNASSNGSTIASDREVANLTDNVDQLTLNYGSVVRPGNSTVLISTSEYAYLDTNQNDELDDTETLASRPVVTTESIGDGRVVVVSDSSALINAMLDREDNRAFVEALIAGNDRVALDYSHSSTLPPLAWLLVTFRESVLVQLWAGLLAVWGVAAFLYWPTLREHSTVRRLRRRFGTTREPVESRLDADSAATALRRRRPEWDDARIRRVAHALTSDGPRDPWRGGRQSNRGDDGERRESTRDEQQQ